MGTAFAAGKYRLNPTFGTPGVSIDLAGLGRALMDILGSIVGILRVLLAVAIASYVAAVRRRLAAENP